MSFPGPPGAVRNNTPGRVVWGARRWAGAAGCGGAVGGGGSVSGGFTLFTRSKQARLDWTTEKKTKMSREVTVARDTVAAGTGGRPGARPQRPGACRPTPPGLPAGVGGAATPAPAGGAKNNQLQHRYTGARRQQAADSGGRARGGRGPFRGPPPPHPPLCLPLAPRGPLTKSHSAPQAPGTWGPPPPPQRRRGRPAGGRAARRRGTRPGSGGQ